jgi:hypothetical protein
MRSWKGRLKVELEERATAKLDATDLKEFIEEAMKARGYKVTSGLNNSALTGIKLVLNLERLVPDAKEKARREKIAKAVSERRKKPEVEPEPEEKSKASLNNDLSERILADIKELKGKQQKQEVAAPIERPLQV